LKTCVVTIGWFQQRRWHSVLWTSVVTDVWSSTLECTYQHWSDRTMVVPGGRHRK